MTWIVWGVSASGAAYFADSTRGSAPLTRTASELTRISTVTACRRGEAIADAGSGGMREWSGACR